MMEIRKKNRSTFLKKAGMFLILILAIGLTGSLFLNRGRSKTEVKETPPLLQVITPEPEEVATPEEEVAVEPKLISIESKLIEPETPEEREIRELRIFFLGGEFEEYLQGGWPAGAQPMVRKGIYIFFDSIFKIGRFFANRGIPFRLTIGNAYGYKELWLLRVRMLGPDGKVLYQSSREVYLRSMKKVIDYLIARGERIKKLGSEAQLLLLKEEVTSEERKRLQEISEKISQMHHMEDVEPEVFKEMKEMRKKIYGIEGRIDLTPYLGMETAEVTLEMLFTHLCDVSGEVEELWVEKPLLYALPYPEKK